MLKQKTGMMPQMIRDEALNKVITVVIAVLPAQGEGLPRRLAGLLEQFRFQLILQKRVSRALVD